MSKKIAAGADAIVLDVKVGDGAFMKTLEDARTLAEAMRELGSRVGPRGRLPADRHGPAARRAVGNALEVREALATLRGEGPPDFTELVLDCRRAAARAFRPRHRRGRGARDAPSAAVADGSAVRAYERWIEAQGGDPDESVLPEAPVVHEVPGTRLGIHRRLHSLPVGRAALHLGAGRRTKEDPDRPRGRHRLPRQARRRVSRRARRSPRSTRRPTKQHARPREELQGAYVFADEPPAERPLVLDVLA